MYISYKLVVDPIPCILSHLTSDVIRVNYRATIIKRERSSIIFSSDLIFLLPRFIMIVNLKQDLSCDNINNNCDYISVQYETIDEWR